MTSDLFSVNFHRNSQSFEQNVDNLKGLPQAAPLTRPEGREGSKGSEGSEGSEGGGIALGR